MSSIVGLLFVSLVLLAWKEPVTLKSEYFGKAQKGLTFGLAGLGVSEFFQSAAIAAQDMDAVGFGAAGLAVGWIGLIYGVTNFFQIFAED
ncbi:MAG: hypothetical protein QNL33_19965 [Akkermansiaceae bacterium]|jgi:hypothetical protein